MLFVMVAQTVFAQKTVTGTVTEMIGNNIEPSIGVNVTFVNSQNRILGGVVTDFNGNYSMKVPEEKGQLTLVFSYIGMKTQRVKYNGQATQNVRLEKDNHVIKEVKVSGKRSRRNEMGLTQKQQSFATQKLSMDEITAVSPVTSIEEALQGKLGGVDIIVGGDPGAKSNIRIRGTATLNGNSDPLIVVNGVPYSTDIDDSFDFNTANQEDFAQMLSLNPNDIESIEVLKDAASTAIYGTDGSNGVLLITTKQGTTGKTRFSFSTKNTIGFEPTTIPMLNGDQYKAFIQDAIWNAANARGLNSSPDLLEMLFDTPDIGYEPTYRYFDEYNQNVDWLDYITRNAFTTDNNFSMSGGGERATYRLSMSYLSQDGTTKGTSLTRLNTSIDVGYRFSEKLTVRTEYTYSDSEKKSPWVDSDQLRSEALRKMPNKSPYYIDDVTGEMTDTYFTRQNKEDFQGAFNGSNQNFHPIIMSKDSYKNLNTKEQKMTVNANWYILPELTFYGYVSMKYKTTKTESFLPQTATGVTTLSEYANQSSDYYTNNFSLQSQAKLIYAKDWMEKKHQLTVTGLWKTQQSRSSASTSTRYNVASSSIADPSSGGGVLLSQSSSTSEVRTLSGIGSVVYTFLDRYTVNGTVNYEGRSSLGKNNRWGVFPAVGVSWIMSDEPFMKWASPVLSETKIRADFGMSGNAPSGTSPYIGTYSSLGNYIDGSAIQIGSMQLNNLKWESTKEIDLGIDLNFWDGKLTATFDWYRKTTSDVLQKSVTLPSSIGLSSARIAWYNSGKLRNEGWEFRIDYEVLKTKDWMLKVNYNVNRNKNTIIELPENINEEQFSMKNGTYAQRLISGTAIGSFFGFKYAGVYQNLEDTYAKDAEGNIMYNMIGEPIVMKNGTYTCYPGDAKYEDINHDGKIDQNDIVYIGNSSPMLTGGGGFNLKYKDLSLTVFLNYRLGQKIINTARMNAESMFGTDNQSTAVLRRWRNEGDQTDIPRALYKYGLNYLGSDRFVEDCSYVRLQTLSLSYNLPKKFVKKIGLTSANVFFTGYDLLTFTDYNGQDPEVTLPSKVTDIAQDQAQTPRSKRICMGVNINF